MSEDKNPKSRFAEIREVLYRNHITRGVTPEKLRIILEELGPTYIKLGQIMSLHSDILPEAYCNELSKLNSNVPPMSFQDVCEVLADAYGDDWQKLFRSIEKNTLGSASIAQVHRAVLADGSLVVIKVQRKGIRELMESDMKMLHKLVRLMPPIPMIRNVVDLDMVLSEMWEVAKQEMDFRKEADNMAEFERNNREIRYVGVPKLYSEYTTDHVLVMEYIDGAAVNDRAELVKMGYDLHEIGIKLVNNYIKQVMDDGFFHADPHPGNVKVRDGKIIWIDMGMMGRISDPDRKIITRGIQGIALHDTNMVMNAVLDLGDFTEKPDRTVLYNDLKEFLSQYGSLSMGSINLAEAMQTLMDIMKVNHIRLPHGMTMLCRGLTHMQGDLMEISPETSILDIAAERVNEDMLKNFNMREFGEKEARILYRNYRKGAEIPGLTADILREYLDGNSRLNITLYSSWGLKNMVKSAVRNLVIGLCLAALLVSSAIISTTNMTPKIYGIPALAFIGYFFAMCAGIFLISRYIYQRLKNRHRRE